MSKKNSFHFFVLGAGSALSQVSNFLAFPILTRIYLPEEFATLAIIISLSSFIATASTLRLEISIPIAKDTEEAFLVTSLSIITTLAFAFTSIFPAYLSISFFLSKEISYEIFWTIPLLIIFTSLQQIAIHWYIRLKNTSSISLLNIITIVLVTTIQIGAFHLKIRNGLVYGLIIGQFISTLFSLYLLRKLNFSSLSIPNKNQFLFLITKYSDYLKYNTPYAMMGLLKDKILVLILAPLVSPNTLGLFSVAQRVMGLPISTFGYMFRPVIFFRANEDINSISKIISKSQMFILTVFTIGTISLCLIGPEIFEVFLGSKWSASSEFAILLIPLSLGMSCYLWTDRIFDVLKKQKIALNFEIILTLSTFLIFIFGHILSIKISNMIFFSGICSLLIYLTWDIYIFKKLGEKKLLPYRRIASLFFIICITFYHIKEQL